MKIDLARLKWPNGKENLNPATGIVTMGAGSQSQRFELGGFHSMSPFGGWPDQTPGLKFDEATLKYDLTIPDGFEWVHGGKIPGLGGNIDPAYPGHSPSGPAQGLNWTVRPMWAEGGRLRLYSWDMGVPPGNYPSGYISKHVVLSPGNTYRIAVRVRMNRVGKRDGYASVHVDGKLAVSKRWAQFRKTDALGIDSILFSVFYGGSGPEYAPQHDQQLKIENLEIYLPNT